MLVSEATAQAAWEERATDHSPIVQRSKSRSLRQARLIVDAGRRLLTRSGEFTTQQLTKEAGVALQTFYRYFASKDQLLLAVLEDLIAEQSRAWESAAAAIDDPIERLHLYITRPLSALGGAEAIVGARAVTAEHWRLQQLFPDDTAQIDRPLVDLVRRTLEAAHEGDLASPNDPEHDARLIVDVVRSTYHHYAYASLDRSIDGIAEHIWLFCLRAIGGTPRGGDSA
jgi:AcrR family transcriptional regulator